jgi:ABC-type amino acid transport substrate-binding protein
MIDRAPRAPLWTVLPLLLLVTACATPAAPLHLASDTWPPYTGDRPGAQVSTEIVAEAMMRSGQRTRTTITDWTSAMAGLRDARFDGSAAVWRNAEREKVLLFSRAYLENRLVLVGRKGADVGAASLAELDGKTVAVVEGYAYGDEVAESRGPKLVEGANDQENLERLLRGDVDFMLVDDLLIRYVLARQEARARQHLEIGTTPLIRRPLHFAVRRDLPGAAEMVKDFDAAIGRMMADGTYNRILRMNWIRADVDGDGRLEYVAAGAAGKEPPKDGFTVGPDDATGKDRPQRYYIDGKVYESWEQVPEQVRSEAPEPAETERIEVTFFEFDF